MELAEGNEGQSPALTHRHLHAHVPELFLPRETPTQGESGWAAFPSCLSLPTSTSETLGKINKLSGPPSLSFLLYKIGGHSSRHTACRSFLRDVRTPSKCHVAHSLSTRAESQILVGTVGREDLVQALRAEPSSWTPGHPVSTPGRGWWCQAGEWSAGK